MDSATRQRDRRFAIVGLLLGLACLTLLVADMIVHGQESVGWILIVIVTAFIGVQCLQISRTRPPR
ncbi:hypothetical protein ACLQ2P_32260 [Actinomadura citrea]|uniref:hypothetical protein n=1 Tax=Actinomadura citrea TaxID=46158 RepID=UPI003CE5369C